MLVIADGTPGRECDFGKHTSLVIQFRRRKQMFFDGVAVPAGNVFRNFNFRKHIFDYFFKFLFSLKRARPLTVRRYFWRG